MVDKSALLFRIRAWLTLFMVGLVLSGLTAFPLVSEVRVLEGWFGPGTAVAVHWPGMAAWIQRAGLICDLPGVG